MTNEESTARNVLIVKFLRKELSEQEMEVLNHQLQEEETAAQLLYQNAVVDLLLNRFFHSKKDLDFFSFPENNPTEANYLTMPQQEQERLEQEILSYTNSMVTESLTEASSVVADPDQIRYEKRQEALRKKILQPRPIWPLVLNLLILVSLLSAAVFFENRYKDVEPVPINSTARITETLSPVWYEGSEKYEKGQHLDSCELHLKKGLVEVTFSNGSNVILKGPCKFLISGPLNTFCSKGEITASVPKEGHGFQIATPFGNIVDLGTEFFVEIDQEKTQVDVIKGLVQLENREVPSVQIPENKAFRIDSFFQLQAMKCRPELYMKRFRFLSLVRDEVEKEKELRKQRQRKNSYDPSLLALFDFLENQKELHNKSIRGNSIISRAVLERCQTTSGPLAGDRAIQLSRKSGILLDLPGQYDSMSFVLDLRINNLKNQSSTLLTSKNFVNESGSLLWQILQDGTIQCFIRHDGSRGRNDYQTALIFPKVCSKKRLGTWISLALVLDQKKKVSNVYLNGELKGTCEWIPQGQLHPGALLLGNQDRRLRTQNEQYLNAAILECKIYDRALSQQEVQLHSK